MTSSAVVAGILLGGLSAISPGTAALVAVVVAVTRFIQRRSTNTEPSFLVGLFLAGFFVRALLLVTVNAALVWSNTVFAHGQDQFAVPALFDDSGYVAIRAWRIVQVFHGESEIPGVLEAAFVQYGSGCHLYLFALFFALFGFSPFAVTVLNCLFGTLTGLVAYSLARDLAGPLAARLAGVAVTFFPSLLLWSITNLKDPLFILLATSMPWAWLRWYRTGDKRFLAVACLAAALLVSLRHPFSLAVVGSYGITWWCLMLQPKDRRKVALILLVICILLWEMGYLSVLYAKWHSLAVVHHRGIVLTGGFTYNLFEDWVYDPSVDPRSVSFWQLCRAYVLGWFHLLCQPFPWKVRPGLSLASLPQMVLWYPMLGLAALGITHVLNKHPAIGISVILHLLLLGSVMVLGGGNIGTDFRMRDALTPAFLVFSTIGLLVCRAHWKPSPTT